uniref:Integrase catalytic domain-containing protein n=1 Tax=Tanacetum cinerariifolium TaxID=118510 RepID=A0A6L2KQR8_TANCI|nr:hypothetical protein [Tanacetum cinerariifolium]
MPCAFYSQQASPKPASSGKRRNRKACFVCKSVDHLIKDYDYHAKQMAQPTTRNHAHRGNHKQYAQMTHHNPQQQMVPTAILTQSKPVSITAVRPVSAAMPQIKAQVVSAAQGLQGKWEWRPKCPILNHVSRTTRNMSYLSDFEVLNGGYVAFGGNPKGGKISRKGKIRTDLTCLFAKATIDESNLWHKRLGYINFKTMNKLVKGNLVRGLPTKVFENNNTCVACKKGKQHRASCKTNPVSFVNQPLFRLHMDLFGPTFVKILNKKSYCLVVTDDYSRNDNGTEFQNNDLNQFCGMKGIKREFSVPRTPQQNGITERKNRTPIEAARTMLADSLLSISFWAEAVNTDCYVQNRVLVTKPHNKTPYELLHGGTPSIGFMRPFGCHVTIPNTLDSLGKFDGKVDEGFLVGCSNTDGDAAIDGKEPEFDEKKPESEVNVSPSSSAQSRKQDNKTKKEAKCKSHVNAAGTLVLTVEQISPNGTNTFSAAGPSNAAAKLEDITYSNDEDDVGAEADFNNLETYIAVSPIPTSRVHKDHPVTQIIGDLSLTTQTRSMTKVVKDQGGLSKMFNDDFHTYMFACFLSQEEPKRKVWILVDLPYGKRAIVARTEAIRLFLAYASFMGFMMYQMDVKSAFLYGTIEEEVYVCQPLGFEDPDPPNKVYKVVKALYGLHQAPRACQDKYVAEILRKFGLQEGKPASTPIDSEKPLLKDPHRSMIGSLMYLTSSRPDIMFSVCACARFQVTPKASHLHAVKRIFRYLKGKPHLGLWYPKDSPFDLVAYSDTDYAGVSLDRKSTTGGCQFLGCRLISWQCKKQTVVATSFTEAKYVASARVNTPRSDEDRLELMELTVLLLPKVEKVEIGVNTVDIQVSAVRHMLLLLVNDVTRLQAQVDKKMVVVTEATRVETSDETVLDDVSNRGRMIAKMDQDDVVVIEDDKEEDKEVTNAVKDVKEAKEDETKPAEVQEVVDVVTTAKLITEVVTTASETVTAASAIITAAEAQVPAATTVVTLTVAPARVAAAPSRRRKGVVIRDLEEKSTASTIILAETKSKDKAIGHAKRMAKGDPAVKRYQLLKRKPQTEAQARKNMMMYLKNVAEAILLARKVPVVDYQIIEMNNKPYYKIIRADDTHQLYESFLSLMRNFDRGLGGFMKFGRLREMYMVQKRSKDGSYWNHVVCVQIITFISTQLILLVKRKYPLTRFTLDQMLNAVRLEVEEESEVSLELLRFTRQQHQEGQLE